VTLITGEPDRTAHFYREVMEMTPGPASAPGAMQDVQARAWGFPEGVRWTEMLFRRPGTPEVPLLRVLAPDQPLPLLRPGTDVLLEGGLSVGFAMRDMPAAVARGEHLGFTTTAGIATLAMRRGDGSPYESLECHFEAPDHVLALGVARPADLSPVGPIEIGRNVGGPAYSAQVVNNADPTLAFYTQVVGYEIRRDVEVSGPGPEKGLRLPSGTRMRFLQVFAPGATTGYLVFLDFAQQGRANPALAGVARGVAMWTFPTRDLAEIRRRLAAFGTAASEPHEITNTAFGRHLSLTVRAPNGYRVEFVQRLA
jgi:catechol 2,3-dioxygenase-like lactoylglutathione lyase family enzyme